MSDTGEEKRPEPPEDEDGSADLFRTIGRQVRLLRERAGLTQRELGERLGYSEDLIRSLERGRRTPQPEFLAAADQLLDAGGLLRAATEDVTRAKARARVRHPAWFRDYARLEREAVEISFFSTLTVPGLLQTEAYARTTFMVRQPLLDEATIEQRVAARLTRQEILTRWPAPMVSAVVDESVLRRAVGGEQVRQDQLRHLLRLGRLRSTTIQVLPMACEDHAALEGPFILLTPKGRPAVAYVEVQSINQLISIPDEVRILAARYGSIRGQALSPYESLVLMEKMLGES
ncbi:helix-turn-helix domain-containing protein [Streptomyces lunaelactis]|uniref:helix-turn-helix domain-containing protein n=1 Tax=Streptomyces lunaelactis TaxID=1535768 RepID=UPI001585527E|nr:helix-turn-helix transcriptional regulator [Streptomyces lunaelactis]NUK70341.1 helix-turn-helix domain-containing protein [Streptomyces lunaelactis]NUK81168.1 helix-turn-helix domain-containing protein [Streptomyces lunaelactis]